MARRHHDVTQSPLRAMAAGLDDAALESLTSKGLLRRASADAGSGRAALLREDAQAAAFEIDGAQVQLSAAGLAKSQCTCPAPGVCRHLLAAVLLLRGTAAPAAVDWREVIGAISEAELAAFAGQAAWNAALGLDLRGSTITPHERSLTVDFSTGDPVTFLAEGGLDAALCKAAPRTRKARIAAAVLAARQALGLPGFAAAPIPPTATGQSPAVAEDIRAFLRRNFFPILGFAPAGIEDELRRLALAGRVEKLPRLAGLLRRIAAGMAEVRQRAASADTGTLLALMAEAYALATALEGAPSRATLAGQAQQDYAPAGDLTLFGLGARRWEAPSGAHGVTTHFFAPALGESASVTLARPDRTDVTFQPVQAFRATPVWGRTMAELAAGQVRLTGAQISAARRLSTSGSIQAEASPWAPSAEAIASWPCVSDDWAALEARMQRAFTATLAGPPAADYPVILRFSRRGGLRFDELTQTSLWPLADKLGRWIGLRLDFEGIERDRLLALEGLVEVERFWAVLALATVEEGRIELRPYALWGTQQWLLDFMKRPKTTGEKSFFDRLRQAVTPGRGEPKYLARVAPATSQLLDTAWNMLLRQGERGQMSAPDDFAKAAEEMSRHLHAAGFPALGALFRPSGEDIPEFCLRAAYALHSIRGARARLAWMNESK